MTGSYETLDAIVRARRSVRTFTARPVPEDLLDQLLETASWAPSAGNRQPYRFLVVTSRARIDDMATAVQAAVTQVRRQVRDDRQETLGTYLDHFDRFRTAPCVLVPIFRDGPDLLEAASEASPDGATHRPAAVDTVSSVAAAVMVFLLAAEAAGLATCWMTGPLCAAPRLRDLLDVPRGWSIAAVVPVGYAEARPEPPPRRSLRHLVRRLP